MHNFFFRAIFFFLELAIHDFFSLLGRLEEIIIFYTKCDTIF